MEYDFLIRSFINLYLIYSKSLDVETKSNLDDLVSSWLVNCYQETKIIEEYSQYLPNFLAVLMALETRMKRRLLEKSIRSFFSNKYVMPKIKLNNVSSSIIEQQMWRCPVRKNYLVY